MAAHADTILGCDFLRSVNAHYLIGFFEHSPARHKLNDSCSVLGGQNLDIHVKQKIIKSCNLIIVIVILNERHSYITLVILTYDIRFGKLPAKFNI